MRRVSAHDLQLIVPGIIIVGLYLHVADGENPAYMWVGLAIALFVAWRILSVVGGIRHRTPEQARILASTEPRAWPVISLLMVLLGLLLIVMVFVLWASKTPWVSVIVLVLGLAGTAGGAAEFAMMLRRARSRS